MYDRKASGEFIQRKRLEMRLTQEALSEQAGCSVRHIVNVERGAIGLSIETMLKLCSIFQITPNELLFPHNNDDYSEINWLVESLKSMNPTKRRVALSIVSPYIEEVLRESD